MEVSFQDTHLKKKMVECKLMSLLRVFLATFQRFCKCTEAIAHFIPVTNRCHGERIEFFCYLLYSSFFEGLEEFQRTSGCTMMDCIMLVSSYNDLL